MMSADRPEVDIERTASSLLQPVLKLLFDSGLSRAALDQLIDLCYVQAAMDVLQDNADSPSIGEIAERSGVPGDRVRGLMKAVENQHKLHAASLAKHAPLVAAAERIMTAWYTETTFTDDDGHPLPYAAEDSGFVDLVERFGNGQSALELVELLVTSQSLKTNHEGKLVPQGRHVLAAPRSAELAHNALEALTDLAHAVAVNQDKQLTGTGALQRTCVNERMPARVAPLFRAMIRDRTQTFLESVDDWLVQHEEKEAPSSDAAMVRLGVGVYAVAEE